MKFDILPAIIAALAFMFGVMVGIKAVKQDKLNYNQAIELQKVG